MTAPESLHAKRAETFFEQALQAVARGATGEALGLLRKALVLAPRQARYRELQVELQHAAPGGATLHQAHGTRHLDEREALVQPASAPPTLPPMAQASLPVLTPQQQHALLEETARRLASASQLELLMRERGEADSDAFRVVHGRRRRLKDKLDHAREAWRARHEPAPPAARGEAPVPQLFTHALGSAGALTRGEEVANLQHLLVRQGFHVGISRSYDTSTRLAVQRLQERHGLKKRDGLVGVETRQLLNRLQEQAPGEGEAAG